MSKPLTPEQLVRSAWITELRRQGDRQCTGAYEDSWGRVCALGLLSEIAYGEVKWKDDMTIGEEAGLTPKQVSEVVCANDGIHGRRKRTFAEIADMVEGFK